MIEKALKKISITNYKIVLVPDIHNPPKWVDHVLSIISDFDVIISNNAFTRKLFSEKGYKVEKTPLYEKDRYSGKIIRKKMIDGEAWENLVPNEIVTIIKNVNGVERLKELVIS
jgi:nicotinamide-nucleotide adenylyltransferase